MTYGQPFTPAEVGQVQPGSAAEAGRHPRRRRDRQHRRAADRAVRGRAADRAAQSRTCRWRWSSGATASCVDAARDADPRSRRTTGSARHEIGLLGIARQRRRDTSAATRSSAVGRPVGETWNLSATTLQAMWQMIIGTRGYRGARRAAAHRADVGRSRPGRHCRRCSGSWRFCRSISG